MAKRTRRVRRQVLHLERAEHADLEQFLTSSGKNVELLPERLRDALSIKTGLEDVLRAAIEANSSVAIAGTAGSGKSHLLRTATVPSSYKVIPDLAAIPPSQWRQLFESKHRSLVAGNEGAFLLGRKKKFEGFADVLTALHSLQSGRPYSGSGPIVIDAAAYSPTQCHAIEKMLTLAPIVSYVEMVGGDRAKAAWEMLAASEISRRLSTIVQMAASARDADGFTFRLLWHFVADLALAAKEDVPWYLRVFSSPTEIGQHIQAAFSPRAIPLPHVANRLWHGDINFVRPRIHEEALAAIARSVIAIQHAETMADRYEIYDDMSLLALFALKQSPLDEAVRSGVDLWSSVSKQDCRPVLQAINRYYTYGLVDVGDDLELWLQHETEKRDLKPDMQASFGSARACDFQIAKSLVVGNAPPGVAPLPGGRYLLQYFNEDNVIAVLVLTKDLIDGISGSRSHKVLDRKDVEYDWRLAQFFERIAPHAARADRLHVAAFDFQARTGRLLRWQLGLPIRKLSG